MSLAASTVVNCGQSQVLLYAHSYLNSPDLQSNVFLLVNNCTDSACMHVQHLGLGTSSQPTHPARSSTSCITQDAMLPEAAAATEIAAPYLMMSSLLAVILCVTARDSFQKTIIKRHTGPKTYTILPGLRGQYCLGGNSVQFHQLHTIHVCTQKSCIDRP